MKGKTFVVLTFALTSVLLFLSACGGRAAPSTQTSANTAAPTATLAPSSTAAPAATQTPAITATPSGPFPVGAYKADVPSRGPVVFKFLADGTYGVYGGEPSKGTYVVAGDQIVFTETYPGGCGGPATYRWSFDGTLLRLKKLQEPCGGRGELWAPNAWIKQP